MVGNDRTRWFTGLILLAACAVSARGGITEDRVLILVNSASSSSRNAAIKYRQYHPGVPEQNVVYLSGLPDITGPADEIVTRQNFETCIAQPVRQYLLEHDLVDQIWVIITTAGMPYRIKDTVYTQAVYASGSDAATVVNHAAEIDAASVESELTILWQIDPALDPNCRAPLNGRIVNPYHGYISSMSAFCTDRNILARRQTFQFAAPLFDTSRVYEGQQFSYYRATGGRRFCVKDIYLVARLDGPRMASIAPDSYINRMLEMTVRVSDPNYPHFHGFDPVWSAVVIDDKASGSVSDSNKWYNAGSAIGQTTPPGQYLTAEVYPTPPNVASSGIYRDDYRYAFRSLTGSEDLPDPNEGVAIAVMGPGTILGPVLYDPTDSLMNQGIDANYGVAALCTFGIHQAGVSPTYLLSGGPGGSSLFRPVYGAIFNSTESFNATTFFADANIPTAAQQGKIWQWVYIGGSGAIGHAFEPLSDSAADNDLLFYNYFRDADKDGVTDMTFIEAAYTAIPYLSWATVVVGDPLMHLHRVIGAGPGWDVPNQCGGGILLPSLGAVPLLLVGSYAHRRGYRRSSRGWQ
jgi:hypothetical protein